MASKKSAKKPTKEPAKAKAKTAKKAKVAKPKKAIASTTVIETEPVKPEPQIRRTKAVKKKKKSTKKKKEWYVNPTDFYDQIKKYYETEIIPDVLAESINKIALGLSFAPNFINYSYKDEMIGDAVLKMWSAIRNKKFDVSTKNNPFSYFTTIAFHAFINRIKKEKKHRETIVKYQETFYADTMNDQDNNVYIDPTAPDNDDN
tara:strand:- start:7982 stop:8590 length:609 start_codon:yes stop_codon:yes gene_type:complete